MQDGVDELLATHFAHLFIRDPIVIFEETMNQDDEKSSDHFEVGIIRPFGAGEKLPADLASPTEHSIDQLANRSI